MVANIQSFETILNHFLAVDGSAKTTFAPRVPAVKSPLPPSGSVPCGGSEKHPTIAAMKTTTEKMSKKTFKKAIGALYKEKQIEIKEDGIYLIS